MKKVCAMIPAHNEQENIQKCIAFVLKQTYYVDKILIVLDNCDDNTEYMCKQMQKHFPQIDYIHTINNKNKKAGAMNQGFNYLKKQEYTYLLQTDADSILHPSFVSSAIKEIEKQNLAGVSSRFRLKKYKTGNKLLYWMQYIEYSIFDSIQVENNFNPHVLSGTGGVYKLDILKQYPIVWDENSIVEDFALTLNLKRDGYKIKTGKNTHLLTDYMTDFKALWKQRNRWNYGTLHELTKRKCKKYTWKDILKMLFNLLLGGIQILFLIIIMWLIFSPSINLQFNLLGFLVPFAVFINKIIRFKYILKKNIINILLYLTLIPDFFYLIFLTINLYVSLFQLLFKKKSHW